MRFTHYFDTFLFRFLDPFFFNFSIIAPNQQNCLESEGKSRCAKVKKGRKIKTIFTTIFLRRIDVTKT